MNSSCGRKSSVSDPIPPHADVMFQMIQTQIEIITGKSGKIDVGNGGYNFHTECWFLTLMAHHLSIVPALKKYHRRIRMIGDLERSIQNLEATRSQWISDPSLSSRNNDLQRKRKYAFKV